MSRHSKLLPGRTCPSCHGPMFYDSIKNPYIDDGGETCHGDDCPGNEDPIGRALSQGRSNAKSEMLRELEDSRASWDAESPGEEN